MSIKELIRAATSNKAPKPKSILSDDGTKFESRSIDIAEAPFTDEDSIDERKFQVDSSPVFDGFSSDLADIGDPSARVNTPAPQAPDASSGIGVKELYTASRDNSFRSKLFAPVRDSFSPTLRSLSTIGIDRLGGMDETKMREVLRKVLRTIKV